MAYGVLLVRGLGWLRNAVLRSSGHTSMHDEDATCAKTVAELAAAGGGGRSRREALGVVVARQLSEVPENTMKTGVGIMLTSFGAFWIGERSGVRCSGSDLAILALVALFCAMTVVAIAGMRRVLDRSAAVPKPTPA
ncbi:MAG: hypothetical protein ACYCTE_13700, partial [Acidimicrobiales bacterium]